MASWARRDITVGHTGVARRHRPAGAGLALALGFAIVTSGHVGSSNAYFEGMAGPYPIRVIVRTPGVIPGLAQISVRVTGDELPTFVTARPLRWDAGLEGAPPADTARAIPGEPGLYAAELWLMTRGSYSVRVGAYGDAGQGVALVPVNAVAERRLEMGSAMAVALLGAGVFLFVGAVTIFGAAVRESVLPPGEDPDRRRKRRAMIAMAVGAIVLGLTLWGGWSWWDAVDRSYRDGIFRPLGTTTTVAGAGDARVLTLRIDDPAWLGREWTPLIPDHGKLMHMFLVRDAGFAGFAHVHPESADSNAFVVSFPPLPTGRYRVYADIVHESGFAQTLVDTVAVGDEASGESEAGREPDPDDSWAELPPYGRAADDRFVLPSRRQVDWETGRDATVDAEISLGFRVTEADGTASALEPYMGMLSHAAVTTTDGSVFMHLHPAGSINLAAQDRFEEAGGGAAVGAPGAGGTMESTMSAMAARDAGSTDSVSFPFVFPRAGAYRIFVQVKVDGVVETAVFDVEVS